MKRFLFGQLADKFEGGADIFSGKVIFTPEILRGHAAREAADDERDRDSRAANHGLAVAEGRINNDTIVFVHKIILTFLGHRSSAVCHSFSASAKPKKAERPCHTHVLRARRSEIGRDIALRCPLVAHAPRV